MTLTWACLRRCYLPLAACLLAFLFAASDHSAAQSPLTLFNGTSLQGWNAHGAWYATGGVLSATGTLNRGILTAVPFADYSLSFEYNESVPMNVKLRVGAPREGAGGSSLDLDGSDVGGGSNKDTKKSPHPTFAPGTWHRAQITVSHGQVSGSVDGTQLASAGGSPSSAGYLGWDATSNGTFQVRNVILSLAGLTPAFNGSDLSSWKTVAQNPKSKGGVGHDVTKTLTFGMGGGSTKPHAAKWLVQGGAMHGQDGPGGLEYGTPFEDAIIQIKATAKGDKGDRFTSLNLRNTSGQIDGGYPVGIGPYSGSIQGFSKAATAANGSDETVIIAGRVIAVWNAGKLSTVYTDSRPESARASQGARDSGGVATLIVPGDVQLDVQQLSITPLPKSYGSATSAVNVASAASAGGGGTLAGGSSSGSATAAGGTASTAANATETALLQQQQMTQKQADSDRQSKQHVASLMALALATSDPGKQMDLYNQVVQIDPANAPAVQGYKDAQTKLQTSQAAQEQQVAAQVNQQHDSLTKDQQVNGSLVKAQSAFLAGHIAEAGTALSVAERLAPDNPLVRDLRTRINATSSLHSRLLYLGGGAGLLALVGAIALWFRRKRQQRFPMLEISTGLDAGEQFPVDKDLVRIGAVAQDGGQKNDIVVRDVDHVISRFHCEIARKSGQLYVTDLKSSNGTKLDGTRLEPGAPTLLRRGNRILLADSVELRFGYARRGAGKK